MEASSGIRTGIDPRSPAKRASELAAQQFGSIARRQLLRIGFSPTRVRGWVTCGRLHPRYPGVYAYGRPDLGTEGEHAAALLYAGSGAALGSISALLWLELLDRRPRQIHIDAPGYAMSRDDIAIRHPAVVRRSWHNDLPVVPLPQALVASTAHLRHNSLRLVLARAEFHHLLHLPELHAALGPGRPGTTAVRTALGAHLPQLARCESPLEIDFVLLCERFRIELPEPNPRIGRWRPDMLWRGRRLIVELDGRDAHSTPAQIAADTRRQAELERMGFTVARFTWDEVQFEPDAVAAKLRGLMRGE